MITVPAPEISRVIREVREELNKRTEEDNSWAEETVNIVGTTILNDVAYKIAGAMLRENHGVDLAQFLGDCGVRLRGGG